MIAQRVQVQEVGHVNVLHTVRVRFAVVVLVTRRIVVNFDPLNLAKKTQESSQ